MVTIFKRREDGVALPVMLIILVVMLISAIYLLKASNSSTLSAANMAYDSALSKAADLGLHKGFQYLMKQAKENKIKLNDDDTGNGYLATYDPTQSVMSDAFWKNSVKVNNAAARNGSSSDDVIEYVVHRACANAKPYTTPNTCVMTSSNLHTDPPPITNGESYIVNSVPYAKAPQIHYIITARINGPRGGNVVSQMVVLIDA